MLALILTAAIGAGPSQNVKPAKLDLSSLRIGQTGVIPGRVRVRHVFDSDYNLLVSPESDPAVDVIVRVSTDGQATGNKITIAGEWKVDRTLTWRGRKHFYLIPLGR